MPGLSLCWGNRSNFNDFNGLTEQEFKTWSSDWYTAPSCSPRSTSFLSSSSYYGYERVPAGHSLESMDVDHCRNNATVDSNPVDEAKIERARCRKRGSDEEEILDDSKRSRFQDVVHRERESRQHQLTSHNLGQLGVTEKSDEEDDLLFMEDYLKQTHGCDYYNFKCSYL